MSKASKNPPSRGTAPVLRIAFWMILAAVIGGIIGYQWNSSKDAGPNAAAIRDFIGNYFKTWSAKDMTGYADCFDSTAMIYFVKDGKVVLRENKLDFIGGQAEALRTAPSSVEEHPESVEIIAEGDMAYVRVHWKMTKGETVKRGYDHFILLRETQGWQILSLSFYETKY